MVAALLILLLLLFVFGGLGLFIAKAFLWGLLIVLLVGLVVGFGTGFRGSRA